MSKYVIIDAEAIQQRIEELENYTYATQNIYLEGKNEGELQALSNLLSQSTPLIPELQKTWNAAYIDAMSIDEETYEPLFFQDYISNLKLDI